MLDENYSDIGELIWGKDGFNESYLLSLPLNLNIKWSNTLFALVSFLDISGGRVRKHKEILIV